MSSEYDVLNRIDSALQAKRSPLAGYADYMIVLARFHGISITLSLGIAQAETGCATDPNMSPADLTGHNAWGYGHPPGSDHGHTFANWPDGIAAVTQWLSQEYVYKGFDTVEKVCTKWVGSYSQTWVDNVSATMRTFGGDPEKLARTRLAVSP